MSIGLEGFRRGGDDPLVLAKDNNGNVTGVMTAKLTFRDRVVASGQGGNFWDGSAARQDDNREFKAQFYQALVKSNGVRVADLAVKSAGLPKNWRASGSSLSSRQVRRIMDEAQTARKCCMDQNKQMAREFLKNRGTDNFRSVFAIRGPREDLPASDLTNPRLHALFLREVKRDPNYAKGIMDPGYLSDVAARAIQKFGQQRKDACREQYPCLANFARSGVTVGVPEDARRIFDDLNARLNPITANDDPLGGEPAEFRKAAQNALGEIRTNKDLLRQMKYDPAGWQSLGQELISKFYRLQNLEDQLTGMPQDQLPRSGAGTQLHQQLVREIRHQKDLLLANTDFLAAVRDNDPLSKKWVTYSNLCWAKAINHVIDRAAADLEAAHPDDPQAQANATLLRQCGANFITQQTNAHNAAPANERAPAPKSVPDDQHPLTLGKNQAIDVLTTALKSAGLSEPEVKELTGKASLSAAIRRVANESPEWAPYSADLVVSREGVTRTYRSRIIPAACINARFARRYASDQPLDGVGRPHEPRQGVSSMTRDDHYHPRNLKVSELARVKPDGTEETMGTVIGNGVIDMWDIANPDQRAAANDRQAKEVLEAALSKNDRIRHEALNRAATGDDTPVKMVHVSVNLTTPAGWREVPILRDNFEALHDYQELTYTREQFRAFDANTTARQAPGQPWVPFHVDDDRPIPAQGGHRGQDAAIKVDVDAITFSFGINDMATGKLPDWVGGWANVYEHNRTQMEKFIGDVGSGKFGSRGAEPGGFIGSVYDRLDPDDHEQAELRASIREQTDLVRTMFTTEAFKRGNGDPAKMGRHILYLQGLAEKALKLLGVTDLAATMSKGCKSDKDRGGVTDGEHKHMMITEDMGGQILPDEELGEDDQRNKDRVDSRFGGAQVQLANNIVPGSRELGKLKKRSPDPLVRMYHTGLGPLGED